MVKRTPHPGPLPIGSADSADAEREKRSRRYDEFTPWFIGVFGATPKIPAGRGCYIKLKHVSFFHTTTSLRRHYFAH